MARNLTSGFINAIQAANCAPFILFQAEFDGSTIRLWNGLDDLSWDGETWLGNGWLQGIEGAEESIDVEANDMMVLLSGVPSSVVSLALGSQVQGAEGRLYLGFLDADGAVIDDPYLWWLGYYSHAEIDEEPDESTVKLYYDGPLVDIDRPNEGRWTHDCQQDLFAGDKGFEYVVATANWPGNWGQGKKDSNDKKQKRPQPPRGGGGRRRR